MRAVLLLLLTAAGIAGLVDLCRPGIARAYRRRPVRGAGAEPVEHPGAASDRGG